jgi:photosystem II stability/assembly factor-like uncharacterized protein
MKKYKSIVVLTSMVLFTTACVYFISTSFSKKVEIENPAQPYEFFAEIRSYPDKVFDLKAYELAIKEASNQNQMLRTSSPNLWQIEGPNNIGGRITCMAVSPTNSNVIFVGTPGSGIYKTTNGGTTWVPIFDNETTLYIGAITIDPNNQNIIYAGTGDPDVPSTVFVGNGLYKSLDGGSTWTNVGLVNSKIISKIVINPSNSNEIYVSATGNPISPDNNRGIYKSTDAGVTWNQILLINNQTGVTDLIMNPSNPNEIYAASMTCIRNATVNIRFSNAARVYKTTDGGSTWNTLLNGLPNTKISRYAICMSKQNTSKLYVAVCDSIYAMQGVYMTTDGGISFTNMGNNGILNNYGDPNGYCFGWYFDELEVNPSNDNEIYIGGIELFKSTNGGLNWNLNMPPWWNYDVHADIHCIHFIAAGKYYLGTDGGTYYTNNDGLSYSDIDNIPNTQFYRTEYNPKQPTNYFGGAQDNGTLRGNNTSSNNWLRMFGGDGFQPRFDPTNATIFYTETQNGSLWASVDGGASFYQNSNNINQNDRRNWDMPYVLDNTNANVQYTGTYRVYKNINGPNAFWNPISNDLTDGVIFAERFHNISAIDNSILNTQKIYVGTSDANVWVTQNNGTSWSNITSTLPERYVTSIHASPNFSTSVYVTHTGYKYGEYIPHIHKSTNNGSTWVDISGNLPPAGVNDVLIFQGNENVLFVATDVGVYYTNDGGINWTRLGSNMPLIPVFDIAYNPNNKRLIAATFAKSLQTIDVTNIITSIKSIAQNDNNFAKVYPTLVTNNSLFVELNSLNDNAELSIYNSAGIVVKKINSLQALKTEIEVHDIATGIYFIELKSGSKKMLEKIIKY